MKNVIFALLVFVSSISFGQKYGKDSVRCVQNLSLYTDSYNLKDYNTALPYLLYCIKNCPEASLNMYKHCVKSLEGVISTTKDEILKEKYIDSLLFVYDIKIQYFADHKKYGKGRTLGEKGVSLLQFRPNNYKEAYNLLKESVEIQGKKSKASVLNQYFFLVGKMVKTKDISSEEFYSSYNNVYEIVDYNIKNPKGKSDKSKEKHVKRFEMLSQNIESIIGKIATCEDIISVYSEKAKSSDDVSLLNMVSNLLANQECTESDLFFAVTKKLHEIEPSAKSAYLMGRLNMIKKNKTAAIEYYNQAISLEENKLVKADYYVEMGYAQLSAGKYSDARKSAKKASDYKPEWGKPYILIGEAYAASSNLCSESEIDKSAVYWAASDLFLKAKAIDSTCTEEANKNIAICKNNFPDKELLFFHNLTVGQSYKLDCWIGITTKVKSK